MSEANTAAPVPGFGAAAPRHGPCKDRAAMKRVRLLGAALATIVAAAAVLLFVRVRDLSSEGQLLTGTPAVSPADPRPERSIGVVSRLAPVSLYEGYQPVLDYLGRTTPYRYRLRVARGYGDAVEDLVAGRTHGAFLGSLLYVQAHAAHGVVPLVRPRNARGEPTFESVLVVREDSPVRGLGDLARRSVAVPPPDSFSAKWLRVASPGAAFVERTFAHHEAVVHQVLRGACDAGVVKERVAALYLGRGLRIVARSGPMPGSPFVVPKGAEPAFARAIAESLLALDPTRPADRQILAGWDPEFAWGFAPAADPDYDAFRSFAARTPEP